VEYLANFAIAVQLDSDVRPSSLYETHMKHKPAFTSPLTILVIGVIYVASLVQCWAQTDNKKPPAFGSSLKRPKVATTNGPNKDANNELPEEIIRVDTSLVLLDVLVTDASGARPITGLRKDDLIITEDDRAQEISFFALGDDAQRLPRSIVLIFDRSDSELAYLEHSIEAAKKLVDQLAPTDEMAIVTDDIELAIGFTKDKKKLKQTLNSLERWTLEGYHTRSMQFSALLATLRELIDVKKKRPIIIFQTDGDEVGRLSKWPPIAGEQSPTYAYDMNDVYSEVEKSRAKIYTVVPNDKLIGLSEEETIARARRMLEKQRAAQSKTKDMWYGAKRLPPEATSNRTVHVSLPGLEELREKGTKRAIDTFVQGQAAAARVAELTGGWTSFLETPEQADEGYGHILADINQSYLIGYYPANKVMDGTLRKVRVEVRGHPEYVVHGRRSYYATPR